jgi:hypothetical protein
MITAAYIRSKIEAFECGPGAQETKIFFIEDGEDQALTKAQREAVKSWEQAHPWGQAHIIIFKEVTAHYSDTDLGE